MIIQGKLEGQTLITPAGQHIRIRTVLPASLQGKPVVLLGELDEEGVLDVTKVLSSPDYAPSKDAATLIARLKSTAPNLPPPSDPSWEEVLCRVES